jgi:hypothetical protein
VLLKFSISAKFAAIASFVIALGGDHSIEATLSAVVGDVGVLDATVLIIFGSAEAGLHFIILGDLALAIEVNIFFDGGEVLETLAEVVEADLVVLKHADHLSHAKMEKRTVVLMHRLKNELRLSFWWNACSRSARGHLALAADFAPPLLSLLPLSSYYYEL